MRKMLVLLNLFVAMMGSSLAATPAATAPAASPATGATQAQARPQAFPQTMPRYFEANRGQWPTGQAFRAYGYGYGVTLGTGGVTLQVLSPGEQGGKQLQDGTALARQGTTSGKAPAREVSLRFEGANPAASMTGGEKMAAQGAWFAGNEAEWRSNIPLYERVRLAQVYSGVDATFYGRDGQLEYDLDIAPGAKAGGLVLDLNGADRASIGKNGDLTIDVDKQQIVLHKPLAWQPTGASTGQTRQPVEVSYAMLPGRAGQGQRIGLTLGKYDAAKPLTIDPVLTIATYISSSNTLADYYVLDLALDSANNIYVLSTDSAYGSMTVQKLTPAGTLVYTATFSAKSSNSNLYPVALRVNASGQAYVAATAKSGYPTTSTAYQTTWPNTSYGSYSSGALSVLAADGSKLAYSTYFGGTANGSYAPDYVYALAVDGAGNAYLAGQAGGGSFPTTTGGRDDLRRGHRSSQLVPDRLRRKPVLPNRSDLHLHFAIAARQAASLNLVQTG